MKNTSRMQVTLTLDRSGYFPGEDATLSILVKNPTPQALEILQPFVRSTGYVITQKKDDKAALLGGWVDLVPREGPYPDLNVPTQFIAAGQELHKEWAVPNAGGDPIILNAFLPKPVGDYRLLYPYSGVASVNFRIVDPTLEDWLLVPLQTRYEYHHVDPDGKERLPVQMVERRVALLLLGYQGRHAIVAQRADFMAPLPARLKRGAVLSQFIDQAFSPHHRLADISGDIKSFSATADAAENIVITYSDELGQAHTIKLDPKRSVLP